MELVGPLQLRCLHRMWDTGPATVHDMVAHLNATGKRQVAYTTALTVLRNLKRRHFCTSEKNGRAFIFTPTITRVEYQCSVLRDVRDTLFDGSLEKMHEFMASPVFTSERATATTK